MTELTLTKTRLFEGVWEGLLTSEQSDIPQPDIQVTFQQMPLADVQLRERKDKKSWLLRVPIPSHLISDGVQTFLIQEKKSSIILGSFALMTGDILSYDIRSEVAILREELDMLKRALRRHCLETV